MPALLKVCEVRFSVVPAPAVTLAPVLFVKVVELTDNVPAVTLSAPLLVKVFGLT